MKQQDFFNRLRQSLQVSETADRRPASHPQLFASSEASQPEKANRKNLQELIAEFIANARELQLLVHQATGLEQVGELLVELIRAKEPEFHHQKHVVLHDHPDLATLQLWQRFHHEAVTLHTTFAPDPQIREKTLASFMGVTVADMGISESATVLQITRDGQPRSTSLVPSIHVVLLRTSRLVGSLAQAYRLLEQQGPASATFISGPSKTADIEAQLVHGAHGPREMHVILWDEA